MSAVPCIVRSNKALPLPASALTGHTLRTFREQHQFAQNLESYSDVGSEAYGLATVRCEVTVKGENTLVTLTLVHFQDAQAQEAEEDGQAGLAHPVRL